MLDHFRLTTLTEPALQFVIFFVVLGALAWWWLAGGTPYAEWQRYSGVSKQVYHLLPLVPLVGWLAIPAIGLQASLNRKTFVGACLTTLTWGVALPVLGLMPVIWSYPLPRSATLVPYFWDLLTLQLLWGVMVVQIGAAVVAVHRLQQRMARRVFPVRFA